jgi:hypothetical protein
LAQVFSFLITAENCDNGDVGITRMMFRQAHTFMYAT